MKTGLKLFFHEHGELHISIFFLTFSDNGWKCFTWLAKNQNNSIENNFTQNYYVGCVFQSEP